jgi:hypothetical protein
MATMRKRIDNIVINYIDDELNEYAVRDAILAVFSNPIREFTDAFLNAWVIGGFPVHSEAHNNHLRAIFAKAMSVAVDAVKGDDEK